MTADWFDEAARAEPVTPPTIDTSVPSTARMYDYYLGGKDNFPADRDAAQRVIDAYPEQRQLARNNRGFLVRAVRYLAEGGIDQFIDLGTGIPTSPNVHEVAREVRPDARVVYVDNDPVVTTHTRALRTTTDGIVAVEADIRDPRAILDDDALRAVIDWDRPVAVLCISVLHFIDDADDPAGIIAAFREPMAPGSHLALSVGCRDGMTADEVTRISRPYDSATARATGRTTAEIAALFDGFTLVPPGLVPTAKWQADDPETRMKILAAVGRLP